MVKLKIFRKKFKISKIKINKINKVYKIFSKKTRILIIMLKIILN